MTIAKKKIIIGVVVVVAIVAISLGITLIFNSSSSNSNSKSSNPDSSSPSAYDSTLEDPSTNGGTGHFGVSLLALGDWGSTIALDSCCSKYKRAGEASYIDQQAQKNVAYLLALSAAKIRPQGMLNHGDMFYWNGVGADDYKYRFEQTFEAVYAYNSLLNVTVFGTMGNHDLGGSGFVCGTGDTLWRPCKNKTDLINSIEGRFSSLQKYVSPNNDRWKFTDRYYVTRFSDPDTQLTVDVFHVDTNYADVHGAEQTCCQCFSYLSTYGTADDRKNYKCSKAKRGDAFCFGGEKELFDICMDMLNKWSEESLENFKRDVAKSDADYKVVHTHYSVYHHMGENKMNEWLQAFKDAKVQFVICGHTHAEGHDLMPGTHFVINGAGGGIQSETIGDVPDIAKKAGLSNIWVGENTPYGFFELMFSKKVLRIRFITFGDDWAFAKNPAQTVKGSAKVGHCWDIPIDGSKGQACKSS